MKEKPSGLKVVAHRRDHKLVKGYTDALAVEGLDSLLKTEPVALPRVIQVRETGTKKTVSMSLASLKALFFVRTFHGNSTYQEIKFFDAHPAIEGLWVRITFYDDERSEGVVRNSLDLLTNPGFFLKPPDPDSNNEIVYVLKSALIEFQVLGVRARY
ncbi:MAG: hypothetical protein ACE5HB_00805 [Terriglobia bacterium]